MNKGISIIYINTQNSNFSDTLKIEKLIEDKNKWGRGYGYYMISIDSTNNLEYIMSLIKQAIN